jgi:hypothetical protein
VSKRLYARATPEKVEITEKYSVTQEISSNPVWETGPATGRIEIVVPYDGDAYFTRQAMDDLKRGSRAGNGQGSAVIGHLLFADHMRSGDLRSVMVLHHNAGVIPIEVSVPTDTDSIDQLTADRQACLISYDYHPEDPEIRPIQLDVELRDPDTVRLQVVDFLAERGHIGLSEAIAYLRRNASLEGGLELQISVQLDIPVKPSGATPSPRVELMSVDWPAITSLSSTQLERNKAQSERADDNDWSTSHPVRYNPVLRRLEWEDIPMELQPIDADSDDSARVELFKSVDMRLKIGHPGELFGTSGSLQEQMLKIHAEVLIPDYLLSGLEARLFGATGDWQRRPRPGASGWRQPGERNPWEPELATRVYIDTECRILDMFNKRIFKPYHQFVFDDVIPDDMRVNDIMTVLRNAKFHVPEPEGPGEDSKAPKWLLSATRRQGPDELTLRIAVEGERFLMDRTQIMGDNRIKVSGSKESGRIRLSVLGTAPRVHADLTSEINLLHQALRDRFRFQQTSRR